MNIYFIYVIVHVQMWCVCAQPYVDQTKKIFVLFVWFWKWFVSPMFFKVFQVVFMWKTFFLGVFHDPFHVLAQLGVKWSNFKVFSALHKEFRDCFVAVSRVRVTSEIPVRYQLNFHRKLTSEIPAKISRSAF